MFRRVLALLAVPMVGLLAQGTEVQVRIVAANGAAYRVVSTSADTVAFGNRPIIVRGDAQFSYFSGALTIAAVDSVSKIHIEARENGRLIGTAEGPYVAVLRDSAGQVMVAARGGIPREPFSFSRRRLSDRP